MISLSRNNRMKTYNFYTAATIDYVDHIKLICLGLRHFKKPTVNYVYHIMLDTDTIEQYNQIFKQLQRDDFKIDLFSSSKTKCKLMSKRTNKVSFQKCFAPQLFQQLDQVLWLDADIIIAKEGIDQLFQIELGDFYVAAAYDIPIQYCLESERKTCNVENYFNNGVMMLNLKKLRQDGIDKVLEHDCSEYPTELQTALNDQPIFNYRFKQNVLWISPIYNNLAYGSTIKYVTAYKNFYKQFGWQNINDSNKDTIVFHFAGAVKPWKNVGGVYFPFKKEVDEIYNKIKNQLEREYEQEKSTKI